MWKRIGVFMLVSLLAAGAIGAIQSATGPDFEIIELLQFAPTIGVLVLMGWQREEVQRIMFGDLSITPTVAKRLAVAVVASGAVFGGVWLADKLGANALDVIGTGDLKNAFWVIVIAQFLGCCGEEFGWRCYMQPELEQRYSLPVAAVLTGLMWGFWHTPILFEGPVVAVGFFIETVAWSIVMAVLQWRTGRRALWTASLLHVLINLGLLMWMHDGLDDNTPMMALAASSVVVALVALAIWWQASRSDRTAIA